MRSLAPILCVVTVLAVVAPAQQASAKTRSCLVGAKDLVDASAPRFEQYPAAPLVSSQPAKLNLHSNRIAKTYQTVIREQMREGPNFAGHYRIAVWGCGTSCAQFAVVNLKTGNVLTADGVSNVSYVDFAAEDFLPNVDNTFGGFRFRKNSRLFVLVGSLNEDDSKQGAFYYIVKGEKLQLIHKTIAKHGTCLGESN